MESRVLKASVVQLRNLPGGFGENLRRIEKSVRQAAQAGAGLVVLPELIDTGYVLGPELAALATTVPGTTTDFLEGLAREENITIAVAIAVQGEDGLLRNVSLIITPEGLQATGTKSHLWGDERAAFAAGTAGDLAVADTPVGRVGIAICYEAGFPEVVRDLALRGAEIVAVPSAFGMARLHAWKLMTRSRALENGCFVLAADMIGFAGENEFAGHSTIVNPHGTPLAMLREGEGVLTAELNLSEIHEARRAIPYLRDLPLLGFSRVGSNVASDDGKEMRKHD